MPAYGCAVFIAPAEVHNPSRYQTLSCYETDLNVVPYKRRVYPPPAVIDSFHHVTVFYRTLSASGGSSFSLKLFDREISMLVLQLPSEF